MNKKMLQNNAVLTDLQMSGTGFIFFYIMAKSTKDKQWIYFSKLDYTIETSISKVVL
jgi:hypothetical protein